MLAVTKKILVAAPSESVSRYLRDIRRLAEYEQKVRSCSVSYPDEETATADVSGRFFGLPWRGTFEMRFTADGGFTSRMTKGPLKDMTGGFHLAAARSSVTVVTHYERYGFPFPLSLLQPLVRPWLERSMELELAIIKEGAESLHRQRQLSEIEGQAAI